MAKRRRSCKRKRRHDTRDQAEAQLRSLERNRFASTSYMHAYKCRHCGSWHIGHRIGFGGRRK